MHPTDFLYALRSLRRDPRFTFAALLTLALGIGANAAIFTFFDAVYLRPLPYPHADRLVTLWETPPAGKSKQSRLPLSPATWAAWRGNPMFTAAGAWYWDFATLTGGPWPERVQVQRVAGDYFRALGVQPILGRAFRPEEERGSGCAMLLSARLWRTWLAADPAIVGKSFQADEAPCTILGVMPDDFLPPLAASAHVDAWMPIPLDLAGSTDRTKHALQIVARLAPGVTIDQAAYRLNEQIRQAAESDPQVRGWGARVVPLKDAIGSPKQALFALAGAVGFLLLIACVNVATLFTARAAGQRREIAIRSALGAGRGRLVSHVLAQALVLALAGGAAGLLAAAASLRALVVLAHDALPRLNEVAIDWRILAFTAFLSLATGLLFGLAPAISVTRARLRETLARPRARRLWRDAQAAAEIALAFVLLVGAGLLLRSFQAIRAVDLGFRTENILTANFALPPTHYADHEAYLRFLSAALDRVRAAPGVLSATVTLGIPMRGSADGDFEIYGRPIPVGEPHEAAFRPGDAQYFSTFGMTISRGRAFTAREVEGVPRVALINEKFARQYFPGQDPIGSQIRSVARHGDSMPWMTIVGIVHDTRHIGPLRDSMLEIYFPYAQFRSTSIQPRALVVRTIRRPEGLLPSLQRAVAAADPDQPLVSVSSMEENLTGFIAPQRFGTALMTIFAAIGLSLAAVGIFGVMSYRVAQRTHEIGIRMALGARRADVRRMVLSEALGSAAAGLAAGWIGASLLTRYLAALLFTIKPGDPPTLAGVSVLLLLTALAAAHFPARRAARIDPMSALRTH